MPTRSRPTRMDDKGKDHIDLKRPPQGNHHKQQKTHNVPTYDVENTNRTNKGRDLTSCGLFPDEQKGCCKGSRSK